MADSEAPSSAPARRPFSTVELLIALVILGGLLWVIVPQFTSAAFESRDATLKDALRYVRTQITMYQSQHGDVPPGYPSGQLSSAPDAATFIAEMTRYTDEQGRVSATQSDIYHLGPYLSEMPANPISSESAILVVAGASMPEPDPSQPYGWIYNPQTLQIIPNLGGKDEEGVAYASY